MEHRDELEQLRVRLKSQSAALAICRERRDIAERGVASALASVEQTKRAIYALELAAKAEPAPVAIQDVTQAAFDSLFGTGDDRGVSTGGFPGLI